MHCCYCVVTHGHIDHVGPLEALVEEYPKVQILFHEAEAPFLTGDLLALNLCDLCIAKICSGDGGDHPATLMM